MESCQAENPRSTYAAVFKVLVVLLLVEVFPSAS
jgi:hypothetical protein